MSKWQELAGKVATQEVPTQSTFKLVDESKQKKEYTPRIGYSKREKGKLAKQLYLAGIALPFNPMTGEEDVFDPENPSKVIYNRDNKFRLQFLNLSTIGVLKSFANKNNKTKEKIMRYSGVTEWDTSDLENITEEDIKVFQPIKREKLYTLIVTNINLKGFQNKLGFGTDYIIDVKRDPKDQRIIGEVPVPLKINKLMRDMAYEEINEIKERVKLGKSDLTKDDLKTKEKNIKERTILVSSEYPSNYVLFLELPLNEKYELDVALGQVDSITKYLKYSKYKAEIRDSIENLKTLDKESDNSIDFYELDMVCPLKAADSKELGKKTRYKSAKKSIVEAVGYEEFEKELHEFFMSSNLDIEKIFMNSAYIQKYHKDLDARMLDAAREVIDIDSNYLTKKVIEMNQEILQLIFEDDFEKLQLKLDMGLDENRQEGVSTEQTSEEMRKINVEDMTKETDETDLTEDNEVEEIKL